MTVFLDYKYVDEGSINALEMTSDENDIKRFEMRNKKLCGISFVLHVHIDSLEIGSCMKYSTYQVKKNQSKEFSLTITFITTRKTHPYFYFLITVARCLFRRVSHQVLQEVSI